MKTYNLSLLTSIFTISLCILNVPSTQVWAQNTNTLNNSTDAQLNSASPMNGLYTIDPSGNGDFSNFVSASEALARKGINGNVLFNVLEGIYDETFVINKIIGCNPTNSVNFIGENDNVILRPSSISTDYIMYLNKVSHIQFTNIHFDYNLNSPIDFVVINGPASNITFDSCQFVFNQSRESNGYYDAIDADSTKNIEIKHSQFYGGTTSLYTYECDNIIFTNNYVQDFWSEKSVNILLKNNQFNHTGFAYGIYLDNCDGYTIDGNTINNYPMETIVFSHYQSQEDVNISMNK